MRHVPVLTNGLLASTAAADVTSAHHVLPGGGVWQQHALFRPHAPAEAAHQFAARLAVNHEPSAALDALDAAMMADTLSPAQWFANCVHGLFIDALWCRDHVTTTNAASSSDSVARMERWIACAGRRFANIPTAVLENALRKKIQALAAQLGHATLASQLPVASDHDANSPAAHQWCQRHMIRTLRAVAKNFVVPLSRTGQWLRAYAVARNVLPHIFPHTDVTASDYAASCDTPAIHAFHTWLMQMQLANDGPLASLLEIVAIHVRRARDPRILAPASYASAAHYLATTTDAPFPNDFMSADIKKISNMLDGYTHRIVHATESSPIRAVSHAGVVAGVTFAVMAHAVPFDSMHERLCVIHTARHLLLRELPHATQQHLGATMTCFFALLDLFRHASPSPFTDHRQIAQGLHTWAKHFPALIQIRSGGRSDYQTGVFTAAVIGYLREQEETFRTIGLPPRWTERLIDCVRRFEEIMQRYHAAPFERQLAYAIDAMMADSAQ